jgi:hypothetical protein
VYIFDYDYDYDYDIISAWHGRFQIAFPFIFAFVSTSGIDSGARENSVKSGSSKALGPFKALLLGLSIYWAKTDSGRLGELFLMDLVWCS